MFILLKKEETCPHLILRMQIHLSSTLHGAKEITEALVDLIHQLLQRIEPALFGLTRKRTQSHVNCVYIMKVFV